MIAPYRIVYVCDKRSEKPETTKTKNEYRPSQKCVPIMPLFIDVYIISFSFICCCSSFSFRVAALVCLAVSIPKEVPPRPPHRHSEYSSHSTVECRLPHRLHIQDRSCSSVLWCCCVRHRHRRQSATAVGATKNTAHTALHCTAIHTGRRTQQHTQTRTTPPCRVLDRPCLALC